MTASIRLKIAVLAPMPSASESTAAAVKPGVFAISRTRIAESLLSSSSQRTPRDWRQSSLIASTVPNSMRARRMASAGDSPVARQILGAGLDVKADLVAHLALETIATERACRRANEVGTT